MCDTKYSQNKLSDGQFIQDYLASCEGDISSSIGNITYHHKYYPTTYDLPNVPWYQPNSCPFAKVSIMPTIFPPRIGTDLAPFNLPKTRNSCRCPYQSND